MSRSRSSVDEAAQMFADHDRRKKQEQEVRTRSRRPNIAPTPRPMRRSGPRPPFDTSYVAKVTKSKDGKPVEIRHGGAPKKLTRGLKKHLRKVHRQNRVEAERQLSMVNSTPADLAKRKRS